MTTKATIETRTARGRRRPAACGRSHGPCCGRSGSCGECFSAGRAATWRGTSPQPRGSPGGRRSPARTASRASARPSTSATAQRTGSPRAWAVSSAPSFPAHPSGPPTSPPPRPRRTTARQGQRQHPRERPCGGLVGGTGDVGSRTPRAASALPVETVAVVREAAALMSRKDPGAAEVIGRLPHQAGNWMLLLEDGELSRLAALPSGDLWRHVSGVQTAPGLRPIATVSAGAIPTQAELDEIVRRSMRDLKHSTHEIARMAERPGSAPRPRLPTEPLYGEEAERSFAASPRPAVAY